MFRNQFGSWLNSIQRLYFCCFNKLGRLHHTVTEVLLKHLKMTVGCLKKKNKKKLHFQSTLFSCVTILLTQKESCIIGIIQFDLYMILNTVWFSSL